jgi:hypothetical protein
MPGPDGAGGTAIGIVLGDLRVHLTGGRVWTSVLVILVAIEERPEGPKPEQQSRGEHPPGAQRHDEQHGGDDRADADRRRLTPLGNTAIGYRQRAVQL